MAEVRLTSLPESPVDGLVAPTGAGHKHVGHP